MALGSNPKQKIISEPSLQKKNIVIIGGSLTGLLTAIPLLRLGHNVTILERTPSSILTDQGAGIASIPIIPPLIAALKGLSTNISPLVDFFHEFDRTNTPFCSPAIENFKWLNRNGEVKKEVPSRVAVGLADGVTSSGGCSWDLLYNILRANFDGGLESSYVVPAVKLETDGEARYFDGVKVTSILECGDKVEVSYERGSIIADFVVGADGPGSTVRRLLLPESERTYVGYVAWRGTVRESELSVETRKLLGDHVGIYHAKGTQVLTYKIPGINGSIQQDEQLINIVWYENFSDPTTILTDSDGVTHTFSLGIGKINPAIKATQLQTASRILPPPMQEIWSKIPSPFIQAITDNLASRAVFMGGKVVLVGDALAGFRPHTTAGTAQGAMHALLLRKVFGGEMKIAEWEEKVLGFAKLGSAVGVGLGMQSQFGKHPMADGEEVQEVEA